MVWKSPVLVLQLSSKTIFLILKKLASLINFKKKKNTGKKVKKIGERILKKTIKEIDNLIINEFKKT